MGLNVDVEPNPMAPSTSVIVNWSYTLDAGVDAYPNYVQLALFDDTGNQLKQSGQLGVAGGGPWLITGLTPSTRYYIQACQDVSTDAGDDLECSAWNAYAAETQAAASSPGGGTGGGGGSGKGGGSAPQPPALKIVGAKPYPNHLANQGGWQVVANGVTATWVSSVPVVITLKELNSTPDEPYWATGGFDPTSASPEMSGTLALVVPTSHLGEAMEVLLDGVYNSKTGAAVKATPFVFTAASNAHSLRSFLAVSGLRGNAGIRQYLPKPAPGQTLNLARLMGV